MVPTPNLPDHTEETIRSIAQLRAEHHENATALERALDHVTALLSRPWFVGVITVTVIGWIGLNLRAVAFGVRPIDPPPLLVARRCGLACIALHGRLDPGDPAA